MDVTGIIKKIGDTQRVSDRFQKRELVITLEANTPYPQHVEFQVTQDKCQVLDAYKVGNNVTVYFNIRGREWSGPQGIKYFNTLDCWKIVNLDAEHHHANEQAQQDNDDLPF